MRSSIFLLLISLLISVNTFASDKKWIFWSSDENSDYYYLRDSYEYYETSSRVWFVQNLKKTKFNRDVGNYKSVKFQFDLNCKDFEKQLMYTKIYSGDMGTGRELIEIPSYLSSKKEAFSSEDWNANYAIFCKKKWEFWK